MKLFNKNLTVLYIEDRTAYIGRWEDDAPSGELEPVDIPVHVIEDGRIQDASQLQYILKRALEERGIQKDRCLFIVNTAQAVVRSLNIPSMSTEEVESLIENERENLFVQEPDEYDLDYTDYIEAEGVHHLLVAILPKAITEAYRDLAKRCDMTFEGIVPLSVLSLDFCHHLGGGRMYSIAIGHLGFHYVNENRYYARTEQNEAMVSLLTNEGLEFSEMARVLRDNYEERVSEIDRERFCQQTEAAFYGNLALLERMSNGFSPSKVELVTGSLVESGIYGAIMEEGRYRQLPLGDLIAAGLAHKELLMRFQGKEKHTAASKKYILPLVAVALAFCILLGTFLYGEKLKEENRALSAQSDRRQEEQMVAEQMPNAASTPADVGNQIKTIQASVPADVILTGVEFRDGTIEITGETKDETLIDPWIQTLEQDLDGKVTKEPSASVGDVVYFRLMVLPEASSGEESASGMQNQALNAQGDVSVVEDMEEI